MFGSRGAPEQHTMRSAGEKSRPNGTRSWLPPTRARPAARPDVANRSGRPRCRTIVSGAGGDRGAFRNQDFDLLPSDARAAYRSSPRRPASACRSAGVSRMARWPWARVTQPAWAARSVPRRRRPARWWRCSLQSRQNRSSGRGTGGARPRRGDLRRDRGQPGPRRSLHRRPALARGRRLDQLAPGGGADLFGCARAPGSRGNGPSLTTSSGGHRDACGYCSADSPDPTSGAVVPCRTQRTPSIWASSRMLTRARRA